MNLRTKGPLMHRLVLLSTLATATIGLAESSLPELEVDPLRYEASLVTGYNGFTGDAGFLFEAGPGIGISFEMGLIKPRQNRIFRTVILRLTATRINNNGVDNVTLNGNVYDLEALLVANASEVVKPYGILGIGLAQLNDERDFITASDGIGLIFGIGAKIHAFSRIAIALDVTRQELPTKGRDPFSPDKISVVQTRLTTGYRF